MGEVIFAAWVLAASVAAAPVPKAATPADPAAPPPDSVAAEAPGVHPFACPGEAASIMRGLNAKEIGEERDKWLAGLEEAKEPAPIMAHRYCVEAELMRRIGDPRADRYYRRALEANPREPGYDLWYGYYLRNVRGPAYPLLDLSEAHHLRALQKLEVRRSAGTLQDFDAVTRDWTTRGLAALYQEDGFALLPWKAYPYVGDPARAPGLSFTSTNSFAHADDDFMEVDEVRDFTTEAQVAAAPDRLNRDLTKSELAGIARANWHAETFNRLRLRQAQAGAFDFFYRYRQLNSSQIVRFIAPNDFGDVSVKQMGVGWSRPFDLYPVADLLLEARFSGIDRTGTVEYLPDDTQSFKQYEVRPVLSRFFGPDKATLRGVYVLMDIPDVSGGVPTDRARGREIMAAQLDYALYRPLLLPQLQIGSVELKRMETRGWHFYGGLAQDRETYGLKKATKRDFYAGTTLMGLKGFDFTLQGTLFTFALTDDGAAVAGESSKQYRTSVAVLKRLVDEDVVPGMPRSWLGLRPASLNLVTPLRLDLAIDGPKDFENVRGGAELWGKAIVTGLRGASFLATLGYEYEHFYRLDKGLHLLRADLRLGWAEL